MLMVLVRHQICNPPYDIALTISILIKMMDIKSIQSLDSMNTREASSLHYDGDNASREFDNNPI